MDTITSQENITLAGMCCMQIDSDGIVQRGILVVVTEIEIATYESQIPRLANIYVASLLGPEK